jgi:alpha-L-fucosidase
MKKQKKMKSAGNTDQHMQWWRNAKFGMFIHWKLYALAGRSEWVMNFEDIPPVEYRRLGQEFNPRYFNAAIWAKTAREAGMKYMVLTAKHHDGFCMWNTKTTEFNSFKTAAKRDFVAEYVTACRAEGLKVGIYFSLVDWNHATAI